MTGLIFDLERYKGAPVSPGLRCKACDNELTAPEKGGDPLGELCYTCLDTISEDVFVQEPEDDIEDDGPLY